MSLTPIPGFPCLTENGRGIAYWVIDYGPEHHILWGVVMDATGQIWWVPNDKIRAQKNISLGRVDPENIAKHNDDGLKDGSLCPTKGTSL